MIDITNITQMTNEQVVGLCHNATAMPGLIILFISLMLIFLGIGMVAVRESRKKFLSIWFLTFIVSLIVLVSLLLMPNATQWITNFFSRLS